MTDAMGRGMEEASHVLLLLRSAGSVRSVLDRGVGIPSLYESRSINSRVSRFPTGSVPATLPLPSPNADAYDTAAASSTAAVGDDSKDRPIASI